MSTVAEFTLETNCLIYDLEKKYAREKKEKSKITRKKIKNINKLIKRYNDILSESQRKLNTEERYKVLYLKGQRTVVSKFGIRQGDIRQVIEAIRTNSFDNLAEYKQVEIDGVIIRKKRYKPYRIKRFARLLKAAKESDYNLFENFIKIPDVNNVIEIIMQNEFGDLDVYMGNKDKLKLNKV